MNGILYSMFISLLLRMSVITVFILAIKAVFRYKLSAKMHSLIWLILCVQLIFCLGNVRIETDISMYNYIGSEAQDAALETIQTMQTSPANHGFDIRNLIAYTWFFGAVMLFIWYVFVFIHHRYRIKKYPVIRDEKILAVLEELKCRIGIYGSVILRSGDTAMTDSDTIIVPEDFPENEMRQILLHELCHYKNKDCLKLWAAITVLCINWFNPIIWYAFKVFRTDIEMLCDDRVLKLTDSKKCYAQALVKSSMKKARFVPGTTSASNGKHEVIKRVKRIVSWKRKKPVWMIAAICVCVCVSCICLTDAVTVAVESSVDSVASTPEPAQTIGDIIPIPISTPEPPQITPNTESQRSESRTTVSVTDTSDQRTQEQTPSENESIRQAPRNAAPQYGGEENTTPPQTRADTDNQPVNPPSADIQPPSENVDIEIGSSRDDVYEAMGDPESSSLNGSKETYKLDDETTAVLQYQDGKLEYGYIIDSGSGGNESVTEDNAVQDDAPENHHQPSGGSGSGSSRLAPSSYADDNSAAEEAAQNSNTKQSNAEMTPDMP